MAYGWSATTVTRKMIVSATSRMFRAISLGVFCRDAPSTRAIIRSRKLCPGSVLISTTMRSESTVVPPVTAHRSPPDSRITGADSPVMADSSTEAMPSTTSPSPGMTSPAWTTTRSPTFRLVAGTVSSAPPGRSRRAVVSFLARRSDSAWALPRPSATASAMFAKTTVAQSQIVVTMAKVEGCTMQKYVVNSDPTHTTNITGDRKT